MTRRTPPPPPPAATAPNDGERRVDARGRSVARRRRRAVGVCATTLAPSSVRPHSPRAAPVAGGVAGGVAARARGGALLASPVTCCHTDIYLSPHNPLSRRALFALLTRRTRDRRAAPRRASRFSSSARARAPASRAPAADVTCVAYSSDTTRFAAGGTSKPLSERAARARATVTRRVASSTAGPGATSHTHAQTNARPPRSSASSSSPSSPSSSSVLLAPLSNGRRPGED